MQPHVKQALDSWYVARELHQETAQQAFTAAFPALSPAERCQCSGPTPHWVTPGEGQGKVCFDDHGRVTIEFQKVSKAAVGAAMTECWGAGWFEKGPGGFAEAEPGQYHYEDDQGHGLPAFRVQLISW